MVFVQLSKGKRGRNTAPSSESEEEESEEEENDEEERTEPEPPKKKTKAPRKDDQMTKSIKRVLEKKFQARKASSLITFNYISRRIRCVHFDACNL